MQRSDTSQLSHGDTWVGILKVMVVSSWVAKDGGLVGRKRWENEDATRDMEQLAGMA